MKRLVACALLASCSSHRIVVMGAQVHAHLGELRRTGQAEVAVGAEDGDRAYDGREVIRYHQPVTVDGKKRELSELAYTCPDQPPEADAPIPDETQCELLTRREDPFLLRTEKKFIGFGQIGGIVIAVGAAGALVGGLACSIGCDSPYQEVSIAAVSVLVLLALASCARSTTCHD